MSTAAPISGGIVFKKGPSGWKERWCIMKSHYFVYFKDLSLKDQPPQGYFDVTDCKCSPTVNNGKSKWKFEVEDRTGRIWSLYVENDKARNQWVNAFRKIASAPTQLLPEQQVWEGDTSTKDKGKDAAKEEENNNEDEDGKSTDDEKSFVKKLGNKFMGGEDKSKKNKKGPILREKSGFGLRASRATVGPSESNSFQTGNISTIPVFCPYQVKELSSPTTRTTTLCGDNRLMMEEEEMQRNEAAIKKGMETKNRGTDEIDSDGDDLLPEEREQSGSVGCAQQ